MKKNTIFLSYRRGDADQPALYLYQHLCSVFGEDRIFRDRDTIHCGEKWRDRIESALQRSKVVLIVIGRQWLEISDENGKQRLKKKDDIHRWEIETALRKGCPCIIPIITEDALPLDSRKVPQSIKPIFENQWLKLSNRHSDMVTALAELDREINKWIIKSNSIILPTTEYYLAARGPFAHQELLGRPQSPWETPANGVVTIQQLRARLLTKQISMKKPIPIRVSGTLLPCALLASGWWEKNRPQNIRQLEWRNPVQKWLFHGFELWGPSWDFSWNIEDWDMSRHRPCFIAQIGEGDEVNSLPVIIPHSKANKLISDLGNAFYRGEEVEIQGVLGHRKHFADQIDQIVLELFGGLLDFCLWIDESNPKHGITSLGKDPGVYSGYLWKCVAPKELIEDHKLSLNDVYFIWEHTNFASRDAVKYDLDALQRKEEYIQKKFGGGEELILVQKSSCLVPGSPKWKSNEIFDLLLGRRKLRF